MLHFDTLAQMVPDNLGLIVVSQPRPADLPTPLATALVAGLKGPQVQTAELLASLQQQLGVSGSITLAAVHQPSTTDYLAGAPPPPQPPAPVAVVAPTPAPSSSPPPVMPSDEQMADIDRRRVQTALAHLGYYDGKVDGIFGSETRAAIRRYQHELGGEMTGRLTAAQASRLVAAPMIISESGSRGWA